MRGDFHKMILVEFLEALPWSNAYSYQDLSNEQ